jgi:hypothetical protein
MDDAVPAEILATAIENHVADLQQVQADLAAARTEIQDLQGQLQKLRAVQPRWRWLRELLYPADKCQRLGHRHGVRLWAGWIQHPGMDVPEPLKVLRVRAECCRCGSVLSDWTRAEVYPLAQPRWWSKRDEDQFRQEGELCRDTFVDAVDPN